MVRREGSPDETEMLFGWMERILGWYREGKLRPTVGASFSFAEAAQAHHYIQDRKNVGKVVLVP
jgi:NADPH:quinone reductase-like Zn-dependent oxidoreductase